MLLPCLKRHRSAIFREADEVEMVVMIGKNRFGLVAEIHEELKVSGGDSISGESRRTSSREGA